MSRVGKKPIKIASGVKVNFSAPTIELQGKAGKLKRQLHPAISVDVGKDEVTVKVDKQLPDGNALHGLSRSLVQNMMIGVSEGFTRDLELQGVGYRAQAKGKTLNLQLGFSHPVEFPLPEGVTAAVQANTKITIKGPDKEVLGQVAAKLREIRPPEPYKGKGIRYQGEVISLKQGKAAGGGK